MFIYNLIILMINFFYIISTTTHNSFTSNCGTYSGKTWTQNETEPKKNDCYDENNIDETDSTLCCFVSGIENLIEKTACFNLTNSAEERIKTISEMEEIATKIKIDCGIKKSFEHDCGVENPTNANQCNLLSGQSGACCLINIKSDDYNGSFCKHFTKKLDINTIGDAVLAAKTVNAILDVNCNINKIKENLIILFTFIMFVI